VLRDAVEAIARRALDDEPEQDEPEVRVHRLRSGLVLEGRGRDHAQGGVARVLAGLGLAGEDALVELDVGRQSGRVA
jgi:hypothetical protein